MKVGILSDIHAQPDALERALELLERRGAQRFLCAGDVMDKGPDHERAIALLESWFVPCVLGNHDEGALLRADFEQDYVLSGATHTFLTSLPRTRDYELDGQWVTLAHGTPTSNTVYFFGDRGTPKAFKKWARKRTADIVILGHTHQPMAVEYAGMWVLNPGSVSGIRPRDSHTCGLLDVGAWRFEVLGIESGEVEVVYDLTSW